MFKTWLKKYSLVFLVFLSISVLIICKLSSKECVLCTEPPHHAPCLLNLATGEMGELTVYDTHGNLLLEEQTTGTFSLLHCAGLTGYRDTACELCQFDIPVGIDKYNSSHFCSDCRTLLTSYKNHTFVLVDTFNEGSPLILPITESVIYELRCYRISTENNAERSRYELTVNGTLKHLRISNAPCRTAGCKS